MQQGGYWGCKSGGYRIRNRGSYTEAGTEAGATRAVTGAARVGSNSQMHSLQSPCIRELSGRRFVESTLSRTVFMSRIPKQKKVSI
jgi:hypothetical protein